MVTMINPTLYICTPPTTESLGSMFISPDTKVISVRKSGYRLSQPGFSADALLGCILLRSVEEVNSQTDELIWILEMTSMARVREDMVSNICIRHSAYHGPESAVVQSNIMASCTYSQSL